VGAFVVIVKHIENWKSMKFTRKISEKVGRFLEKK